MLGWVGNCDAAVLATMAAYTAHEVRNPLAALRAMAQLTMTSSDVEVRQSMMRQIVASIDELDQFLQQVLVLLRPELVSMQRVDLGGLLEGVAQLFAVQAADRGSVIRLRFPGTVPAAWGNPDLLRHVFINLIKNALEAMPDGGPIIVKAGECARHGTVWVTVRDRGQGIPASLRTRVFTDPAATSGGLGSGIGLPFVRQVVNEIHGGRVAFKTKTGAGTVFCVELPWAGALVGGLSTDCSKGPAAQDWAQEAAPERSPASRQVLSTPKPAV